MLSKQEGKVVVRGYFEVTSLLAADPRSLSRRDETECSATDDQKYKKPTNKAEFPEGFTSKRVPCGLIIRPPSYAALISLMFKFFQWKFREYRKSTPSLQLTFSEEMAKQVRGHWRWQVYIIARICRTIVSPLALIALFFHT
jgi:hypothetical protein